jgi:uncharacterized membrane protein YphA (DoxX/SURF4 family)
MQLWKKEQTPLHCINRLLLGLVMIIPGLLKLFQFTPAGVAKMLGGFGFPMPLFWAWLLILSEIIFGIAILIGFKLKWTIIPPVIILLVAAFTAHKGDWSRLLIHLVLVSNYFVLGWSSCCKKGEHEMKGKKK